jgi:hypothetical protein
MSTHKQKEALSSMLGVVCMEKNANNDMQLKCKGKWKKRKQKQAYGPS